MQPTHTLTHTGQLAVIGVLMETNGPPNQVLTSVLKYAPPKAREEIVSPATINPAALLPRGPMNYVRYAGSLTTPGCSEGVDWYVMLDTISVSPEQVRAGLNAQTGTCWLQGYAQQNHVEQHACSDWMHCMQVPAHPMRPPCALHATPRSRHALPMQTPQVLGFAQYVSGGRSFAQNSRPLQPLNGRAFDMQYDCNFV